MSKDYSKFTPESKVNIALTKLFNALESLCAKNKDQANEQLFGPQYEVIRAYEEYKKAVKRAR